MFARTDRLMLRPGWPEDAPALFAAIADEAIIDKLPDTPWPYRPQDAEAYLIRDRPADTLPDLLVYARTRGHPRLIGGVALRARGERAAELDYWIARDCWGLGFATEAAEAVTGMARDGLRLGKLESGRFRDNPASGRVLEKLGFVATGAVEQRRSQVRGEDVDCLIYATAG